MIASILPTVTNLLLAVNIIVSILLILLVLMQRPKNEGLGAAFGGDSTSNLFGAQTTNVLANITRWLGGTFMALTLLISVLYSKQEVYKTEVHKTIEAGEQARKTEILKEKAKAEEAAKNAPPETEGQPKVEGVSVETTPVTIPSSGTPGAPNQTAVPSTPAATPEVPAPAAPATPAPAETPKQPQ